MIKLKLGDHEYSARQVLAATVAIGASIAAAITYGGTIVDAAPRVVWKTQSGHDQDVARLEALIEDALMATAGEVGKFRDEWKCDEYEEELEALLRRQDAGEGTATDGERIRRLRELIGPENLNCARFED